MELDVHRTALVVSDESYYAVAKDEIMTLLVRSCPRITSISHWHALEYDPDDKTRIPASNHSPWQCVKPAMDYILVSIIAGDYVGAELFVEMSSNNVLAGTVASPSTAADASTERDWSHAGSAAAVGFYVARLKRYNELRATGMKHDQVTASMKISHVNGLTDEEKCDAAVLAITRDKYIAKKNARNL
jgi:hypothetical protein